MNTNTAFLLVLSFVCINLFSIEANSQVPEIERSALIALFDSTDGENWTTNTNWDTSEPVSTWHGVGVVNNHVATLLLNSNSLTGIIPIEIGDLIYLTNFQLVNNNLSGTIPIEIGNLNLLTSFNLSLNSLTGNLPSEIGNLSSLSFFRIGNNDLDGSIPSELWELVDLFFLDLSSNQFTGELPAEISNLSNIVTLLLYNNELSGPIPSEIGELINLNSLRLSLNLLSDSIPTEIGNLTNLQTLNLNNNSLVGPVPVEIGNLSNLTTLNLNSNQLDGNLPVELWSLSNLTILTLGWNLFEGEIPSSIVNLSSIESLWLNDNLFTGNIPTEFGNLNSITTLFFDNNNFDSMLPIEISYLSNLVYLGLSNNSFDSIPDLSGIPSLENLYAQGNSLEFDELEPHVSITNFSYSPQSLIPGLAPITISEGNQLSIEIPVGGEFNVYQWYKDGIIIDDAISDHYFLASANASDAGAYTLEITNTLATELTLYTGATIVDIVIGIDDLSNDLAINTYPNPVREILNIKIHSTAQRSFHITIIDLAGREYFSSSINSEDQVIDVSFLPSGIYMLKLQDKKGIWVRKFVKSE